MGLRVEDDALRERFAELLEFLGIERYAGRLAYGAILPNDDHLSLPAIEAAIRRPEPEEE